MTTNVAEKSKIKPSVNSCIDENSTLNERNKIPQRPPKPEKYSLIKPDNEKLEKHDFSNTSEKPQLSQHQLMKALEEHHMKQREEIVNRYKAELTNLQLEQRDEKEKIMKETIKNEQNTIDGQQRLLIKQKELSDKESLKSSQSSTTLNPNKLLEQKEISSNDVGDKRTLTEDKKQDLKFEKQDTLKPNVDKNEEQATVEDTKKQQEVKQENLEAVKTELLKKQEEELELQRKKQQEEQRRLTRQLEQEKKVQLQLKKQQILTDEQQQKILYCSKISIKINFYVLLNGILFLYFRKEERIILKDRAESKIKLSEEWERTLDAQTGRFRYVVQ